MTSTFDHPELYGKAKGLRFRDGVIAALADLGIDGLSGVPEVSSLAEALDPAREPGSIRGVDEWVVRTIDRQRHDLAGAIRTVRLEAEDADRRFYAAVLAKHAYPASEAHVVLDLPTFAALLRQVRAAR